MNNHEETMLLDLARDSIHFGLHHHRAIDVSLNDWPETLTTNGASFVTLHLKGELRGCIGSLEACEPLVKDVACNAFNAAFHDPRFSPVTAHEAKKLELTISILSQPEPITFHDEDDLLSKLRPNEDGLILTDGRHRGTFLPSVWEQCPAPAGFLQQLKRKAGLPIDYWSENIRIERYTVHAFS